MPAPRTGDEIVDTLLEVAHRLRRVTNERLRESVGLTLPRLKVLELLSRRGPLRLRDCALALGVAPRTMTELIDDLQVDDLVTRGTHPTDRRAVLIALTEAGRDRLERARDIRAATVRTATGHLRPDDRRELLRLLESLRTAIDRPDGPEPDCSGPGAVRATATRGDGVSRGK
ncbi:MAG: MarR family winged helix-turn-helix transcriptional regulator [Frankia sp.]